MSSVIITPPPAPLRGEYTPPGDRRVTHSALLLGALTEGPLQLLGALESPDTVATRRVLAHLGLCFSTDSEGWLNVSQLDGKLHAPDVELDCGASLVTMRLVAGLLAGQKLNATLTGDGSLLAQPFAELAALLGQMGAEVECLGPGGVRRCASVASRSGRSSWCWRKNWLNCVMRCCWRRWPAWAKASSVSPLRSPTISNGC